MKWDTRKITGLAMVAAISYAAMFAGFRFMAAAPYLKYEPKDVIITIGGFIFGPLEAVMAAFVVAFMEMVTVSESGIIGFLMNFLAAASYAGVASLIYRKIRTAKGALSGLLFGSLSLTAVMLLWNYIITPIYTEIPREDVAKMLLPVFLPFNLIKAGLNSAFILLIYKPLTTALRKARLLPAAQGAGAAERGAAPQGVAPQGVAPEGAGAERGKGAPFKVNLPMLLCAALLLLVACAAAIYFTTGK